MTDDPDFMSLGARAGAEMADGLREGVTAGAQSALEPIRQEAELLKGVFEELGDGLASELRRAAQSGEFSFKRLGLTLAAELGGALGGAVGKGLGDLIGKAVSGGRADGGLVAPGASFLVGERGPELFTPAAPGRVSPTAGAVSVNVTVTGVRDVESFRRAEATIGAAVARGVARAQRQL